VKACQAVDGRDGGAAAKILVIKLSALGDFILALPAMAAIRRRHPAARIALLTTAPFSALAERSGWFDTVEIDTRPRWHDLAGWRRLRRFLRGNRFDRVYDLQSQDRTAVYFRLFWPGKRPEWSGIAPGASHRHRDPGRRHMHALDIHAAQLRIAGIDDIPPPDLSWIDDGSFRKFGLPKRFALLAPGAAPHRPAKRWASARYGALAARLVAKGIIPVVLGSAQDRDLAVAINAHCPKARDLTGQTSLFAIGSLAAHAELAVGNDTGPMHLIAMTGCRSLVLFSAESNPARAAPRGEHVTVLQRPDLSQLTVDEVAAVLGI
jgi:ADP-heptose:LPS heptosyltransferase